MNQQIDPRGPKFTAAITAVVLAVVLWTAPSTFATVLLAVQTVLFGLGAALGIQRTPTSWAFRNWIRPRLAPPDDWEDPAPPRFAQGVGFAFGAVGVLAFVAGAPLVGSIAVGFALAAAVLNAVFGLCLGCEVYLLLKRFTTSPEDEPITV
jgi:Domain of unknown function (DUF4395)